MSSETQQPVNSQKNDSVTLAIAHLLNTLVHKTKQHTGSLPRMEIDDSLPDREQSPAFVSKVEQTKIEWLPAPNGDVNLFDDLERGLELTLHHDLKQFYGAFWSEGICCQSGQGLIRLIQIWNETDLDLLRENLLGHAFMKTKKRQPLTFFFGLGDGETILTLENDTGCVYMEIPGQRPHLRLANNLTAFLCSLEVTLLPYGPS